MKKGRVGALPTRRSGCPPWATHLTRCSAALRLPPSLPLMSPYGLPSAGSVGSHSPEMSHPSGCLCSLPRNRPVAWFPASPRWNVFAPAQLALRANLWLVYLAPAPALDCLSLEPWRYRAGDLRFATVASFAPAHLALRAAFGRLPSQRPLACVQVSNFRFQVFSSSPP